MKYIITCFLLLCCAYGFSQHLTALNNEGNPYILGMDRIVEIRPNPTGGSILVYGQKLKNFYSDEDMGDIVFTTCSRFFVITDAATGLQRALNKDYVEYIFPDANGKGYILMKQLDQGNPNWNIRTLEDYAALDTTIITCDTLTTGPLQVLSYTKPLICLTGGGCIDISDIDTNTDNQQVTTFSFDSGSGNLSFELEDGGGVKQVNINGIKDDWGNQVVITDSTLTGDGTPGDPLSAVISHYLTDLTSTIHVQNNDTVNYLANWGLDVDITSNNITYGIDVTGADTNYVLIYDGDSLIWSLIDSLVEGDNWGTQVAITDTTLTGDGTSGSPLHVFLSSKNLTDFCTTEPDSNDVWYYNGSQWCTTPGFFPTGFIVFGQNGLTINVDTLELGGTLIKNTTIDQMVYDMTYLNANPFTVVNSAANGTLTVSDSTGAQFNGTFSNHVRVNEDEITVDGGTGKTFWKYGGASFGAGAFLHVIDAPTTEIAYADYRTPPNNAGGPDFFAVTDNNGNLDWIHKDSLGITGSDDWGNGIWKYTGDDGFIRDVTEGDTLEYKGFHLILTDGNAGELTIGIDTSGATLNDVITFDGSSPVWQAPQSGADDWGNANWTFTADSGPAQTVDEDENVDFAGNNLIETINSTNQVTIQIDPTGALTGDVVYYDGANVIWEDVTGLVQGDDWGNGDFSFTGDTGPAQTVVDGDVIDFQGVNLIKTTAVPGEELDIGIDDTGAITGDVITFDGVNVGWGGSTGNTSVVTDTITGGQKIATHNDGDGTLVGIYETITTMVDNGDSTYTYTSEDGTVTEIVGGGSDGGVGDISEVINTIGGNKIADHIAGGDTTAIRETVTTLVDNADSTYTYTAEDGTVTNILGAQREVTNITCVGGVQVIVFDQGPNVTTSVPCDSGNFAITEVPDCAAFGFVENPAGSGTWEFQVSYPDCGTEATDGCPCWQDCAGVKVLTVK